MAVDTRVFRILDANLNRAVEGIRVLEDAARMLLDDARLTAELKALRHDLAGVVRDDPMLARQLLAARDSDRDVLRPDHGESAVRRMDAAAVVRANGSRAREAVRTIEEYAKLGLPDLAARAKAVRFRLYDLERELVPRLMIQPFADGGALRAYVILDGFTLDAAVDLAARLVAAGATAVACNPGRLGDGDYTHLLAGVRDACPGIPVLGIDRPDCALAAGCAGVQLSPGGLTPGDCRRIAGPGFAVGRTVPPFPDDPADFDYFVIERSDHEAGDSVEEIDTRIPMVTMTAPDAVDAHNVTRLNGILIQPGEEAAGLRAVTLSAGWSCG